MYYKTIFIKGCLVFNLLKAMLFVFNSLKITLVAFKHVVLAIQMLVAYVSGQGGRRQTHGLTYVALFGIHVVLDMIVKQRLRAEVLLAQVTLGRKFRLPKG